MKAVRPAVLPPIPKKLIEQFVTRRMTSEKVAVMSFGTIFRATMRQAFNVKLTRNSLASVRLKGRRAMVAALNPIYRVASTKAADPELDAFERGA